MAPAPQDRTRTCLRSASGTHSEHSVPRGAHGAAAAAGLQPQRFDRQQAAARLIFHGVVSSLCVAEQHFHAFYIPGSLGQSFVLPFAPWLIRREEVPAIDMDRSAHLADRVRYGMDGILPERDNVAGPERPCACRLYRRFFPPPENIVFPAGVNAD